MQALIDFCKRIYAENPSVAAILGVSSAGFLTSVVYVCRQNIQNFFYWIKKQFTTSLTITNDMGIQLVYDAVTRWFMHHNNLFTRVLRAPTDMSISDMSEQRVKSVLQYGLGSHLIFFKCRPVWITIEEEKAENTLARKLSIRIDVIGRKHTLIYDILNTIYQWTVEEEKKQFKTKLKLYNCRFSDYELSYISKRDFRNVYLPDATEKLIKSNIQSFLDGRATYESKGIPYHYGMILYGPPGTGKTSVIKAIASEFGFPIYNINPLECDLGRMIIEEDKIYLMVIEDIDLLFECKREGITDEIPTGKIVELDTSVYFEHISANQSHKFHYGTYEFAVEDNPALDLLDLYLVHNDKYYKLEAYNEDNLWKVGDVIQNSDIKPTQGSNQLRKLMNDIDGLNTKDNFVVIATTNAINSLDSALIRPGRFDTLINIGYVDMEVFNKVIFNYFGKTVEGQLKDENITVSKLQVDFLMGLDYNGFINKYIKEIK